MKLSAALSTWLSISHLGSSLQTHLPAGFQHRHCHLCDLSFDAIIRDVPCLHWCISPYCKPHRLSAVLDSFNGVDVIQYLYLCMVIEQRGRQRSTPFFESGKDGTRITIRIKSLLWIFHIAPDGVGEVELRHRAHGPRFKLPLMLEVGQLQTVRALAHLQVPDCEPDDDCASRPLPALAAS